MAVSLAEMKARLSPEDRADVERQAAEITAQVRGLQALRLARSSTQVALGQRLGVSQASVAKLEQRTDMHLSTLREYVEALGGHLDLVVRFDDEAEPVRIAGLSEIADEPAPARRAARTKRHHGPPKARARRVLESA